VSYSKNINNCHVGTTQLTDYKCITRKLEVRKKRFFKKEKHKYLKMHKKMNPKK